MQSSSILTLSKINILVVPIHTIPTHLFSEYLALLAQHQSINLLEVNAKASKLTDNITHSGSLYLNFTSDVHDGLGIDEIILSRQIFGVVGVADCRYCQNLGLGMFTILLLIANSICKSIPKYIDKT